MGRPKTEQFLSQMFCLTKLNLGPGGNFDNSDTFTSDDGGEPMAGDHYGIRIHRQRTLKAILVF